MHLRRLSALALAAVMLAGCATVDAPGTGSLATGPQDTSRTLRIMGADFPYTDATVAEFSRLHPDISVQYVKGAVSFEEGSAQTMLRSGRGPDVLLVNSGPGRVGMLADAGLIMPLDDTFDRLGVADRFDPEVLRQTKKKDGHIYEVVEGLDVFQVYYNRTIFQRYGVAVPRDWDGLLAACATLKAHGVPPLLAGVRDNFMGGWLLGALVQASAGQDTMRQVLAGQRPFDDPAVVEGGRMLKQLLDGGCLDSKQTAALDGEQSQAAFWKGKGAMTVVPQGSMAQARHDGTDVSGFGSFPMPPRRAGGEAVPTAGLSVSWVVNNSTRSKSAVNAWVQWITSPEYLALTSRQGRTLVPAQRVPAGLTLDPAVQDGLQKVSAGVGFNPSVYLTDTAKEAWYQAVQGLVTGHATPEQAMAGVRKEMEATR